MAYVVPQQDDEEEKQQGQQGAWQTPTLGGGQAFGANTGSAQPSQTPAAQNAQNKGTGFTNLSNWLDAGKGRSQNISSTGSNLLGQEKTNFNNAASGVENSTYNPKTVEGVNANGNDNFAVEFWKAAGGDKAAKDDISGMLNPHYDGPRTIDYDANKQKNLWDTASLANSDTVGQVLARPAIEKGQYTSGMQRLDNALYGADADSRAAEDKVGSDLKDFGTDVTSRTKAAADKVAGFDKAAADASAGTTAALQKIYDTQSGNLDRRVQEDLQKEADHRAAVAQGYYQGDDGKWHKAQNGTMAGATTGDSATRENVADSTQRSGFDLLNQLIGTDKLGASTAPYQGLSTKGMADPNYKQAPDRGNPRAGTIYNMLMDSDPAQAKTFMDAWNSYGPKNNEQDQAVAWREFYDRFEKEHPDMKIPTGEATSQYEDTENSGYEEAKKKYGPYYTVYDYRRDKKAGRV